MKSKTKFIVRYVETDQMGVVHHSVYPIWYEAARTDFIKKAGLPYSEMEKQGIMLPVLEVKCRYKSFARYEDEITVEAYIKELTGTRVIFGYQVYKNDDPKCINEGETMHVWAGRDLRPVNMKKYALDVYNFFEKLANE